MVEGLAAGLTDDSRRVAKAVLHPRLPAALRPVMAVARELSTGLLPVGLRDGFDLRWTPRRQAALDALAWSGRAVLPHVPAVFPAGPDRTNHSGQWVLTRPAAAKLGVGAVHRHRSSLNGLTSTRCLPTSTARLSMRRWRALPCSTTA